MRIIIGSDHRGFNQKEEIKNWLINQSYQVIDVGNDHLDPDDDYPDLAHKLTGQMTSNENSRGILICGSSTGVCIAANKARGIRAGAGFAVEQVVMSRAHDDINVLCLSADYFDVEKNKELILVFLETEFDGGEKYKRRISKIERPPL